MKSAWALSRFIVYGLSETPKQRKLTFTDGKMDIALMVVLDVVLSVSASRSVRFHTPACFGVFCFSGSSSGSLSDSVVSFFFS